MIQLGRIILIMAAILLVITVFIVREHNFNAPLKVDCLMLQKEFDNSVHRSKFSIIENSDSLCYGLNVGRDFSTVEPILGVGRLIKVNTTNYFSLTFQGIQETEAFHIPATYDEILNYQTGEFYIIDMMNICRGFFSALDSRYPSPIELSLTKPERVECI